MFKIFLVVLVLMMSSCAHYGSQAVGKESLRYNYHENEWIYAKQQG